MRTRHRLVTAAAVLAVAGGTLAPLGYAWFGNTSAKDRIAADPPPALFAAATVAPMAETVASVQDQATTLMKGWWDAHGSTPDDAAFVTWLEATLPGPPTPLARAAELADVHTLAGTRTPAGVTASTWLEVHGKQDVWKLYAHDQAERLSPATGDAVKADTDAALAMAKQVADALGTRYQQSAPYVLDPALRPDHTVTAGQVCPCSYPSRHAADAAAARTLLGTLDPRLLEEYQWAESQVDYSRVYMAGHVTSDITGGALLGDLIGAYVARTRPVT